MLSHDERLKTEDSKGELSGSDCISHVMNERLGKTWIFETEPIGWCAWTIISYLNDQANVASSRKLIILAHLSISMWHSHAVIDRYFARILLNEACTTRTAHQYQITAWSHESAFQWHDLLHKDQQLVNFSWSSFDVVVYRKSCDPHRKLSCLVLVKNWETK